MMEINIILQQRIHIETVLGFVVLMLVCFLQSYDTELCLSHNHLWSDSYISFCLGLIM